MHRDPSLLLEPWQFSRGRDVARVLWVWWLSRDEFAGLPRRALSEDGVDGGCHARLSAPSVPVPTMGIIRCPPGMVNHMVQLAAHAT